MDFEAFDDPQAIFVGKWCKAVGDLVTTGVPDGARACRQLKANPNDVSGVPDFWFAGSPDVVKDVFENYAKDLREGVFAGVHGPNDTFHFEVASRFRMKGIKTLRYRLHHVDYDLARLLIERPYRMDCAHTHQAWHRSRAHRHKGDTTLHTFSSDPVDPSIFPNNTYCETGHMLCACEAGELDTMAWRI